MNHLPTSDEIALLRESARELLGRLHPGCPDESWPKSWQADWVLLAELGLWSTIEAPDGSLRAAAAVAEELGRALYSGPSCEVLAAGYVLDRFGDPVLAPTTAANSPAVAFAIDNGAFVDVSPETMLIFATSTDRLVATTAAHLDRVALPSLDVTRRVVRAGAEGAPVMSLLAPNTTLVGFGRAARSLLYLADTLGCVGYVLARTGEYARQRTTFGAAIGKYQAVAHRLVDHAVTAQQMRLLLDSAITAFDKQADDIALEVAAAETFFCRRSAEIISDCIQLAGAIGFTWEFGHHFYLRRVVQNTALGGGAGRPQARLAEEARW